LLRKRLVTGCAVPNLVTREPMSTHPVSWP